MKKIFFIKLSILLLISGCIISGIRIYTDTFNVFHWSDIRFTSGTPNKNFIKTKYILSAPQKFNAFLFGSSRIGPMPKDFLPCSLNGEKLNWYNMTYPTGTPKENLETIKTFLRNGVNIKMAIVQFDDIMMYDTMSAHQKEPMKIPYQTYEKNKLYFYFQYLKIKTEPSIISDVLRYNSEINEKNKQDFYSYGTNGPENDFSDNTSSEDTGESEKYRNYSDNAYTEKTAFNDLRDLSELCKRNNIKLILLTTALYHTAYRKAITRGYLDVLKEAAQNCEFYNFSCLNNFTKNYRYFMESVHFRPTLGLIIEKTLFGSEDEKSKIREEAGDKLWGQKVNSNNAEQYILQLKEQLDS